MLVNYWLGKMTFQKTFLNTNTHMSESVNIVIQRSLPWNVTFMRNFHAQCHSAVHYSNNGPMESKVKLCWATECPIAVNSSVAMQLKRRHRKHIIDRTFYNKKKAYKHNRCKKGALLFRFNEKYQEEINYAKGRLLCNIRQKHRAKYDKSIKDLPWIRSILFNRWVCGIWFIVSGLYSDLSLSLSLSLDRMGFQN